MQDRDEEKNMANISWDPGKCDPDIEGIGTTEYGLYDVVRIGRVAKRNPDLTRIRTCFVPHGGATEDVVVLYEGTDPHAAYRAATAHNGQMGECAA